MGFGIKFIDLCIIFVRPRLYYKKTILNFIFGSLAQTEKFDGVCIKKPPKKT